MPLWEITWRDKADREVIATENPEDLIEAENANKAKHRFMAGKMPPAILAAAYDAWVTAQGEPTGALSMHLEAHEIELVKCPECTSDDIELVDDGPSGAVYECRDCDHAFDSDGHPVGSMNGAVRP